MSTTLLQYLQAPNPEVRSFCRPGTVTINQSWSEVTGWREWREFNTSTLLSCYGSILNKEVPEEWLPSISPELTQLETEVWDEDSLRLLLARSINAQVNAALAIAYRLLYKDREKPVEIRGGGFATSHQETDFRFYPDWAAVRPSTTRHHYTNLCPGETKVGAKWTSWDSNLAHYDDVWRQGQTYAGNLCKTRYGYILTEEELVVFRVRTEKIESGIAKDRERRSTRHATDAASHVRRVSGMSQLSSISSGMSHLSISEYVETLSDVEYGPIEYRSLKWSDSGERMTVKLALFWLLMLASVPGGSKSVGEEYPPLDSWEEISGGYIHTSTGLRSHKLPGGAAVLNPRETSTPDLQQRSAETFIEDVKKIGHNKGEGWKLTLKDGSRLTMNQPRLRSSRNGKWYKVAKTGIDSYKWVEDH